MDFAFTFRVAPLAVGVVQAWVTLLVTRWPQEADVGAAQRPFERYGHDRYASHDERGEPAGGAPLTTTVSVSKDVAAAIEDCLADACGGQQ